MVRLLVLLCCLNIVGCATHYQNYSDVPAPISPRLAHESVVFLKAYFPPARSPLVLLSPNDSYGRDLINELRQKGYSVTELPLKKASVSTNKNLLVYAVDALFPPRLYRITLQLNDSTISRVFEVKEGVITPCGVWSWSEKHEKRS